jgi:hypothetical protein
MLIKPKRRKFLRIKTLKEIGLDENKLQVLFVVNENNLTDYFELISSFQNEILEINIFTNIDIPKDSRFIYHNELKYLFEICDISYKTIDLLNYTYGLELINDIDGLNQKIKKDVLVVDDEVCIVLAHCNTENKIETLKECIYNLKRQNQKVILVSHINVCDEILEMCDFFVFDKKNEMIKPDEFDGRGRTFAYASYSGYYHEHNYDNHALAVLNLMKTGVGLAHVNGFKVAHLIHYDCIIYDNNLLQKHYNYLKKYDIYHYFYEGYENRIDGNFLSVKTDKFLNIFKYINGKEKYLSYGFAIFECFLKVVLSSSELLLKRANIESLFYKNIIDKIQMVDLHHIKEYSDEFSTHTYLERSKYKDLELIVFTTNDFNIKEIIINDKIYSVLTNQANVFKIDDSLLMSDLRVKIPYLDIDKTINKSSRFANCQIIDTNIVNFYDLTN